MESLRGRSWKLFSETRTKLRRNRFPRMETRGQSFHPWKQFPRKLRRKPLETTYQPPARTRADPGSNLPAVVRRFLILETAPFVRPSSSAASVTDSMPSRTRDRRRSSLLSSTDLHVQVGRPSLSVDSCASNGATTSPNTPRFFVKLTTNCAPSVGSASGTLSRLITAVSASSRADVPRC